MTLVSVLCLILCISLLETEIGNLLEYDEVEVVAPSEHLSLGLVVGHALYVITTDLYNDVTRTQPHPASATVGANLSTKQIRYYEKYIYVYYIYIYNDVTRTQPHPASPTVGANLSTKQIRYYEKYTCKR